MSFEIAHGSVIGRDHRISGKNNQDSYHIYYDNNFMAAVVTDGCGDPSCSGSEVGAKLGAKLVTNAIREAYYLYYNTHLINSFWSLAEYYISEGIRDAVNVAYGSLWCHDEGMVKKIVNDMFLFTIVGVFATEEDFVIFTIGDGSAFVNDVPVYIEKWEDNSPPYIGYKLTGVYDNIVHKIYGIPATSFYFPLKTKTNTVRNFLIGTDGVDDFLRAEDYIRVRNGNGKISQFWENDEFFVNSNALTNRLNAINQDTQEINWEQQKVKKLNGPLRDDTTIIVGRKFK